jgi:hypothetical protein
LKPLLVETVSGEERILGRPPATGPLGALLVPAGLSAVVPGGRKTASFFAEPAVVGAKPGQHLGRDAAALAGQGEQDVLGRDVVAAQVGCLLPGELDDLLGARGDRDVPGRALLAVADDLLYPLADGRQADAQPLQRPGGDAVARAQEASRTCSVPM